MDDPTKTIFARKQAILDEIESLKQEVAFWELAGPILYQKHLFLPDDVASPRSSKKFGVLGGTVRYLTKNEYNRKNGASAADIFRQIRSDILEVSPSTFRSYLTRFKAEGRLEYDEQTSRWNLAKRKEEVPKK